MSPALRRSRRSKSSSYSVGDLVEIKRRSRSYTGRLVYRLTEDRESPNPLWLVTFDEGNVKDEEIYEKHFGAILKKGKVSRSQAGASDKDGKPKRRGGGRSAGETNSNVSSASSSDDQAGQDGSSSAGGARSSGRGGRRNARGGSATAAATNAPPGDGVIGGGGGEKGGDGSPAASAVSDSSVPLLAAPPAPSRGGRSSGPPSESGDRLSAREQRSLRRQAKIDEAVATVGDGRRGGNGKRGYGSSGARSDDGKRARMDEDDGECVKVKLHTGTLYLYKGLHRRAEFVRRY